MSRPTPRRESIAFKHAARAAARMTDWLPWGGLMMATVLGSTYALARDGDPAANRALARRIVLVGGALSVVCFALYLVLGEAWLPYL